MKYEVTGDTIIIKYIADGKYKQLELNKNDNIDLDFFGQLIKAKNNKQDAMCDLYAKEVLSYDPSPERITTMSLTKVEEPSDYTKKEAAKLRIEELTRDLKVVEKEIRDITKSISKERRIEDLTGDDLETKNKINEERFKELKVRYLQIKDLIEKEERKYDTSKSEPLSHDKLLKKVSDEFENKISKIVGTTKERRRVMEDIVEEISPKKILENNIKNLQELIGDFKKKLMEEVDGDKKTDESMDSDELDWDDSNSLEEKSKKDLKTILTKNNYFLEQLSIIKQELKSLKKILNKTSIKKDIIKTLENTFKELNIQNTDLLIQLDTLENIIKEIKELNVDNKIIYTSDVITGVLKNVNDIIDERNRISLVYDEYISDEFIKKIMDDLPEIGKYFITPLIDGFPREYRPTQYILEQYFNKTNILLLWKDEDHKNTIFSNKNPLNIFYDAELYYYDTKIKCYKITVDQLKTYTYGAFRKYITMDKPHNTNYELPLKNPQIYLNLVIFELPKTPELKIGKTKKQKYKVIIHGFKLQESNMAKIINKISDSNVEKDEEKGSNGIYDNKLSEASPYSGKIDLDRASTEEKLSEIIRLLQNIGYNLFTLTPNYEESERNKKLKSKGIDLRELFRQKNDKSEG